MSQIIATISSINNEGNLNIVEFNFFDYKLKMMSLDLNTNIKIGTKVSLEIKPTQIALAKEFTGVVSFSNQLNAKVLSCENGKLLSSIQLIIHDIIFESIITASSSKRMDIQINDELIILIKASDLSIKEVLN